MHLLEPQEISRDTLDRYGIEMYYMSESGYFLNFVMGCPFQSTADIFVILLCLPDLAFLLPLFVIPYLFIDNNNTAMCVDMPLKQEGSACTHSPNVPR